VVGPPAEQRSGADRASAQVRARDEAPRCAKWRVAFSLATTPVLTLTVANEGRRAFAAKTAHIVHTCVRRGVASVEIARALVDVDTVAVVRLIAGVTAAGGRGRIARTRGVTSALRTERQGLAGHACATTVAVLL